MTRCPLCGSRCYRGSSSGRQVYRCNDLTDMDCPTGREPVGYTKRQVRMANIHLAIARHELRELLIELTNHGLALGEQDDRYVTGAGDARVNAATKIANKFNLVPPEDWK